MSEYHVPVLLEEALEGLAIKPEGTYVDCTFGGGGHSRGILERLGPEGKLIAFDQDQDAALNVPADDRVLFVPQNFRHLSRFLRLHGVTEVDGILADLGVSSHQFDEEERGFSTRSEGDLDMRMDQRQSLTAAGILADYGEPELHKLFERYGEVTNSRTLSRKIVEVRRVMPLATIPGFMQAVSGVVKGNPKKYFAQVFQALRIAVNDEMGALQTLLEQMPAALKPGGRAVVITFHSLEDRLVKQFFKTGHWEEVADDHPFESNRPESPFTVITRKPVLPTEDERKRNPRSRSAKLRVAEKK
ncbi:MAG TPA: 16S rRNA (cytosine(1402)-N(4))-methyltransferase RsmH [Dinghuibacter sp.]|nr:16S rRNA (cytosine(1402)-N(4))-methyltransferase RsmH [Dinghuibacter sp.]